MIHAGAAIIDSLPHGSFFHATSDTANMSLQERMRIIPYEACIGLTSTIVSVMSAIATVYVMPRSGLPECMTVILGKRELHDSSFQRWSIFGRWTFQKSETSEREFFDRR